MHVFEVKFELIFSAPSSGLAHAQYATIRMNTVVLAKHSDRFVRHVRGIYRVPVI